MVICDMRSRLQRIPQAFRQSWKYVWHYLKGTQHSYHLGLLRSALEKGDAGEIEECLNICSDLRSIPDLCGLIEALVNLIACQYNRIRDLPERVEMAKKALRLVEELTVCLLRHMIARSPNIF